jgi:hypothetical protein
MLPAFPACAAASGGLGALHTQQHMSLGERPGADARTAARRHAPRPALAAARGIRALKSLARAWPVRERVYTASGLSLALSALAASFLPSPPSPPPPPPPPSPSPSIPPKRASPMWFASSGRAVLKLALSGSLRGGAHAAGGAGR